MSDTRSSVPSPSHNQLISLPIFWQVLGLSLVVLVLALGINTLVVLKAPEPPPSGYSLREVITALKSGEVKLQNGRVLKVQTVTAPPTYIAQDAQRRSNMPWHLDVVLAGRIASELHVPADTVWVKFVPRGPFRRNWDRPYNGPGGFGSPNGGPGNPMPQQGGMPGGYPGGPGGPPQQGSPQGSPPGGFQGGPQAGPQPDFQNGHPDGPPFGDRQSGQERESSNVRLASGLDNRTDIFFPASNIAWKLADGRYRVITPPKDWIQPWQAKLLLGFGLTALTILPLAWLLSRRLTRPIIAFSEAAAKVGFEDNAPPVMAVGSKEVRQAADVLNAMQARIRKQMESRTALMGAIAHDLKTPLARMRLRIEDLPGPLRDKLSSDISHMDALIRSAMSFTSAHKLGESLRPLDLSALVEALGDDMAEVCPMEPALIEHNVMVKGDTVALKRILTNLIENACRYAGSCRLELSTRGPLVEVSVIDNGPGVPADMLESVFEPFYRLEESRNRDTGGSGLGLSVARALAEAQGGSLKLINRYAGHEVTGLEARLTLTRLSRK